MAIRTKKEGFIWSLFKKRQEGGGLINLKKTLPRLESRSSMRKDQHQVKKTKDRSLGEWVIRKKPAREASGVKKIRAKVLAKR